MEAIDLPPGCLVETIGQSSLRDSFYRYNSHSRGMDEVEIPPKQVLMYLGVAELGPLDAYAQLTSMPRFFRAGKFFAHQFYYLNGSIYLPIDTPDKYYVTFRKNIRRVNNKSNLCR